MIYKRLQVLAFCLIPFTLSGQDMFPVKALFSNPEHPGFATWSPDSKSIVYQYTSLRDTLGKNGLWKISADGTGARQIFKGVAEHAKWSPDGKYIVFDADTGKSIRMIPAAGGEVIKFLPDSIQIGNGGLPCWSPDGSQIAFVERKRLSLCTFNLKTRELKSLFSEPGKVPLPGGWWTDGKSILVGLMDLKTRKSSIMRIFTDGNNPFLVPCEHENFYRHLALSPDGSLLVFAALDGKYLGLYVMPSEGGRHLPLAVSEGHNEGAVWSPDGKRIAFSSSRGNRGNIWIMDVDTRKIKKNLQKEKKN